MSGRQPHQQQYPDLSRPGSRRAESSRSATAVPSVETGTVGEQDPTLQSPSQPLFRLPQSPRSAVGEAQSKAAKVAIPRLKRPSDATGEGSTRSGGRHRVNHACEPCRHRKTKCSGERPVCRHCQDFKIVCFYADGKRDRVKKQFGSMAEKVADYETLLRDLMTRVSEDDARSIRASLEKASQIEAEDNITETGTAPSIEIDPDQEASGAESEVSGRVGSTGALDRTDEDFTREGAQATGFMGKNSEVTWIQRLRQENRYGDTPSPEANSTAHDVNTRDTHDTIPLAEAVDGFTVHDSSYHLDDLAITLFDTVDPYELPTQETAQVLYNTYMHRVHPTFPIVGRVNLSAQFHKFISNPVQRPPAKWMAIVNLIFAISAKYSHLIQAEWRGDERDHVIYFSRARLLGIGRDSYFSHPDLQTIQINSLMSLYLMCCSQINSAWIIAGIAARHAIALGLNMRNDSANLKDRLKEIRYRLWWSLYVLEHRLCSITGRVNCIMDNQYTTPLPVPIEEDKFDTEEARKLLSKESQQGERAPSSNAHSPSAQSSSVSHRSRSSGKSDPSRSPSTLPPSNSDLGWVKDVQPCSALYFLHLVQLSRLTQNVCDNLYSPTSIERKWSYIQSEIKMFNEELDYWYRKLPPILDFRRKQRDREFYEFRLNLGFFYYSTKQMVNRPCLCRLDRKLPGQSTKSNEFNRSSAASCVEAAQDMLRLIPHDPNAVGLIRVGPWWTILPYLVQSTTVLMLEMTFRAHHMPEDADSILESSKKAIRWLHALGEDNLSAKRAWRMCDSMLREAVVKIGRDVKDIPDKPPGNDSFSSSDAGTAMSGVSGSHERNVANHFQPEDINTTMFGGGGHMPAYINFPGYDNVMHFDRYFPIPDVSMAGLHNSQFTTVNPAEAEMEFMTNAYHQDQGPHQPGDGSGNTGMPGNTRYM